MKSFFSLRLAALLSGCVLTATALNSCRSGSISPGAAVQRLSQSPSLVVYSHNDVHSPALRDCQAAGPLPERAFNALRDWLDTSEVQKMSYVYPQYYLSTRNPQGGNEVVWGICSDNRGNMVGVLVPGNKRILAWDLPTIGNYRVLVSKSSDKERLGAAIMQSLADAGYDRMRIETRKAGGLTDERYLISKPAAEPPTPNEVKEAANNQPAETKTTTGAPTPAGVRTQDGTTGSAADPGDDTTGGDSTESEEGEADTGDDEESSDDESSDDL